jgi:hypothetical protein
MKRFIPLVLLIAVLVWPVRAQNGTPHGINITITPPATIGGSGVIQGYYLFRCPNTCTATSMTGWVSVGALITAASQTAPTSYLDPAAGLSANTTYQYEAETVDSNGNDSTFMPTPVTIAVTNFPTNPNAPSCAAKVQ